MTSVNDNSQTTVRAFDASSFRDALGQFATGVTIITAVGADGTPVGVTANSFNSASLDPPLVLWSLGRRSGTLSAFTESEYFVVHILSADQIELSNRFAAARSDKFEGMEITRGLGGVPLLDGCAARFECKTAYQYEGGDHIIFVGEVQRFDKADTPTLLYHKGKYALSHAQQVVAPGSAGREGVDPPGGFVDDYLAYLLINASRSFLTRFKDCILSSGLDIIGWRTLAHLSDQDGRMGKTMLSKGVAEDADSLLEVHRRLESEGLIRRDAEPEDDELARPIHLTDLGRKTVIPILAAAKSLESDALGGLETDDEVLIFKDALRQLASRMAQPE